MEWINELIGFFIILLVFFIPLLRRLLLDKKRAEQKKEEIYVEEEELEPEPELKLERKQKKKAPPSTQRLVKRDFEFHTDMAERAYGSEIQERHLETFEPSQFKERLVSPVFILKKKKKRLKKHTIDSLVNKRSSGQAMVIFSEILGKPKGLP